MFHYIENHGKSQLSPPAREEALPDEPSAGTDPTRPTVLTITDLTALDRLAETVARQLCLGDVVGLSGPLGSGKTTFTRLLAKHLGITERVTSPTFALIHEFHSGRLPLVHVDCYRLEGEHSASIADALLEYCHPPSVVMVVEWAAYAPYLAPYLTWRLVFSYDETDDDTPQARHVTVEKLSDHVS